MRVSASSLGLDAQLPELTARTAQTARFDRTQYAGLEHARSGRSIREGERGGGVHVFRAVTQSMIRNVAPAMVTEVFTPAQGRGWQGLRKRDASVNSIIAKKGGAPGGQRRRGCWAAEQKRVAHCDALDAAMRATQLPPELDDPITIEPLT